MSNSKDNYTKKKLGTDNTDNDRPNLFEARNIAVNILIKNKNKKSSKLKENLTYDEINTALGSLKDFTPDMRKQQLGKISEVRNFFGDTKSKNNNFDTYLARRKHMMKQKLSKKDQFSNNLQREML